MTLSRAMEPYDAVLLDLDGCLWVGDEATPRAPEALAALRAAGRGVAFLTNDPRHTVEDHVRKLWRLGFRASAGEVLTAGTVVQDLLAAREGGTAFVVGAAPLIEHVALAGMRVVNNTDLASRADVVVVAAHDGLHYAELRTAVQAVLRGAQLVGTSRDAVFPMPDGPWPGSGAALAAVEAASGRSADAVAGKPEAAMFRSALERLQAGRAVMVGDVLDVDVAGAQRAGVPAALVLTGATDGPPPPDASVRPDLVAASFGDLVLGTA